MGDWSSDVCSSDLVRLALENLAIELIVDKISDEELDTISEIIVKQEKLKENYQADEFIRVDREFHMVIAGITENKILIDMLNNLSDMIRRIGVQAVQDANRYMETLDEHNNILNALKEKNKVKAVYAMQQHILLTKKNVFDRFKESQNKENI